MRHRHSQRASFRSTHAPAAAAPRLPHTFDFVCAPPPLFAVRCSGSRSTALCPPAISSGRAQPPSGRHTSTRGTDAALQLRCPCRIFFRCARYLQPGECTAAQKASNTRHTPHLHAAALRARHHCDHWRGPDRYAICTGRGRQPASCASARTHAPRLRAASPSWARRARARILSCSTLTRRPQRRLRWHGRCRTRRRRRTARTSRTRRSSRG